MVYAQAWLSPFPHLYPLMWSPPASQTTVTLPASILREFHARAQIAMTQIRTMHESTKLCPSPLQVGQWTESSMVQSHWSTELDFDSNVLELWLVWGESYSLQRWWPFFCHGWCSNEMKKNDKSGFITQMLKVHETKCLQESPQKPIRNHPNSYYKEVIKPDIQ